MSPIRLLVVLRQTPSTGVFTGTAAGFTTVVSLQAVLRGILLTAPLR